MKEKALEYLNKDYLLNVDMIECIRRDICRILYASDKAVLIVADSGWVHMLSCEDRELGLELIKTHQPPWVVLHQMDMREAVAGLGYRIGDQCWQSAYTKTTPMEETLADIRRLDRRFLKRIADNYELADEEEIAALLDAGVIYGAFAGGELAGFIGKHEEGSVGLLFVFPEFRRMGIAEALERNYVNRELAEGNVAYGQIFVGNTPSRQLQEKLGMDFSDKFICWCGKSE